MSSNGHVYGTRAFAGRVELRTFASACLAANRVGDPHEREVPVYLPPGWDSGAKWPVLFVLAGFTGRGQRFLDVGDPWKPGLVLQYDRRVAAGELPPAILVLPDCFTEVGGSQYVNSSLLGRYEDYVADELVPFVDATYPTLAGARAVVGKSSGGFGALHFAMRRPSLFRAAASISGDCGFEFCQWPTFEGLLRTLRKHGGDPWRFLDAFKAKPSPSTDEFETLNAIAMSACYSPNPQSPFGFDLPIDVETGARREDVWRRWREFDPLFACERYAENLKRLAYLHVECGLDDEFNMQWPLRQMVAKLRALGVPVVHEEHDGSHRNLDHRYMALFPKLVRALE
ncbi:MAG: esterase family protein [Planctomycetes bacterium]|nr:esterase family protein [Planctomycetota bacterium]